MRGSSQNRVPVFSPQNRWLITSLAPSMTRHGTLAEWLDDFAAGLCWGALSAVVFVALLMPGDALRAVEAAAMLIGGM